MVTLRSSPLALLGGQPVCPGPWPDGNTIGEEEKQAVLEVLDSGVLSGFKAGAGPEFLGGPRVRELERQWAAYFGVTHAVAFNSLTSGLFAAIGALGIGPGDEVIVSPFTMSASAVCPLAYGATPVFADIDPETFCLDPESVAACLTPKTRAIVVVHLFGRPAEMAAIMALATRHGLRVIEDCAQAPAAKDHGRRVGTIGDIGGFSLNAHKTIHCGEGGVLVTDDDELALRLQLIRNHGEVAVEGLGADRFESVFGGNHRMTEIEAAIAAIQLQRLEQLTEIRVRLAAYLSRRLADLPGVAPPRAVAPGSRHVFYRYAMRYQREQAGLPRELFVSAVRAEGIELRAEYVRPIYWEPLFQRRGYARGLCPAAEAAYERDLIFGHFCRWPLTERHMDEVVGAFEKVLRHREQLLERAGR